MIAENVNKYLSDRRLIFVVTTLLMVTAGYQLSVLIWKLVPQPSLASYAVVTQSSGHSTSEAGLSIQQKVAQITSQNLFGQAQSKIVAPVVVQDAPKSSLSYKLRGIYYSVDESLASIILQKNSNETKFYRLGDEIASQIFIHQIQPDHVIISRSGKLEKLVLEKPTTSLKQAAARQKLNNLQGASSTKVLQNYRRRYSNNPMALAKRFKAIPVSENGRNIGYKLQALRGEQLLKKLNLQKDDVFVSINGIGLDKPFQALDALKSLTTAKDVSLTVLRNGNRETLDFNL